MMAVDLHSKDSLMLPSQLFTEDNNNVLFSSWNTNKPTYRNNLYSSSCFGSSDFGSAQGLPVETELGRTESDSDQDGDCIAKLTRQMAHYMVQDDDSQKHQQTSRNYQEESTMMGKFQDLNINEDIHKYNNREMFVGTCLKPNSVSSIMRSPSSCIVDFYSKVALIDDQIRAIQFHKLKQKEESMNWRKQVNEHKQMDPKQYQVKQFQRKVRPFSDGLKISWNNLQQQNRQQRTRTGSEMRAVFLDSSVLRNGGSSGTGVFLPRGIGNTSESQSRKKSGTGCSTVLLPARVVQALKLHFDKMDLAPRTNHANFPLQHDVLVGDVMYGLQLQKPATNHQHHQEISLPQEWLY